MLYEIDFFHLIATKMWCVPSKNVQYVQSILCMRIEWMLKVCIGVKRAINEGLFVAAFQAENCKQIHKMLSNDWTPWVFVWIEKCIHQFVRCKRKYNFTLDAIGQVKWKSTNVHLKNLKRQNHREKTTRHNLWNGYDCHRKRWAHSRLSIYLSLSHVYFFFGLIDCHCKTTKQNTYNCCCKVTFICILVTSGLLLVSIVSFFLLLCLCFFGYLDIFHLPFILKEHILCLPQFNWKLKPFLNWKFVHLFHYISFRHIFTFNTIQLKLIFERKLILLN